MTNTHRRPGRLVRLVAPGALAAVGLGLLPGVAGAAARDIAPACANAPEDPFTDAGPEGSGQEEAIQCVRAYGVTSGTSATTFSPGTTVSRGQLAIFFHNTLTYVGPAGLPTPGSVPDAFTDDDGTVYEDAANVLASLEIVGGFGGGVFDPARPVTRAQTTRFVANVMEYLGVALPSPTTTPNVFTDDEGNTHEKTINQMAFLGIVGGKTLTTYDPEAGLTRGQMALILARHLAQLVDDGVMPADDFGAPVVVEDSADNGDFAFNLWFDEPVSEASAENVANYTVANGPTTLTVATAVRDAEDDTHVFLSLASGQTLDCSAGAITLDQTVQDTSGVPGAQKGYELVANCPGGDDNQAPRVTWDSADDGDSSFTLYFNENVSATSAADTSNYTVTNGATTLTVTAASRSTANPNRVNVTLGGPIDCAAGPTLLRHSVADLAGNTAVQSGYVLTPACG